MGKPTEDLIKLVTRLTGTQPEEDEQGKEVLVGEIELLPTDHLPLVSTGGGFMLYAR